MAKWQRTLHLQPEWGMADRREITAQQLAAVIAKRLRALPEFRAFPRVNEEREFIAEEFEDFAGDETGDFDDLDDLMDRLYNWGDWQIGGQFFDAKKVCWIATVGG